MSGDSKNSSIYTSHFPVVMHETLLRRLFNRFGPLKEVACKFSSSQADWGPSHAFITYENGESAKEAIEALHGSKGNAILRELLETDKERDGKDYIWREETLEVRPRTFTGGNSSSSRSAPTPVRRFSPPRRNSPPRRPSYRSSRSRSRERTRDNHRDRSYKSGSYADRDRDSYRDRSRDEFRPTRDVGRGDSPERSRAPPYSNGRPHSRSRDRYDRNRSPPRRGSPPRRDRSYSPVRRRHSRSRSRSIPLP